MNRKVAIYARVSTEHEAQLSALDNQVQYYDDILEKHPNWTLYDRYIDEGITGTSIKKRKNFIRMMKDAHEGKFDLIITREVSRFARNTVDTLQETRKLKKIGVEVYFTEDNIWTFKDDDDYDKYIYRCHGFSCEIFEYEYGLAQNHKEAYARSEEGGFPLWPRLRILQ